MAMKTMGETISVLRKEKKMTQMNLAEKMNVTDKAVSKWERDLSCPDINSIPRLAEVLGVSVEELVSKKTASEGKQKTEEIIGLILRAIPVAMGVAVVVTSLLKQIDLFSALTMLGIGLACLGVYTFQQKDKE